METPQAANPTPATPTVAGDALRDAKRTSQAMTGVLLVALGAIFLVDQVGWRWGWHASFRALWPLLLIVAGIGTSLSQSTVDLVTTREVDGRVVKEVRP